MGASSWPSNDNSSLVLSFQLPRGRAVPHSTLFENNSYIRMLNKLLQLELGSIELYRRCSEYLGMENVETIIEAHRQQAKNLVNLIVFNRGVPEERGFTLSPEIGMLAHSVGRQFGAGWAHRTSIMTCLHLERMLQRKYQSAIKEAPYTDRSILQDHVKRTGNHIAWLSATKSSTL